MKDFLETIRRQVTEFMEKRSRTQKILMLAAVLVLIVGIIVASTLLGRVEYRVLYTGLDEAEAGEVMALLDEKGVSAQTRGSGTILVPSDSEDRIRMDLAAQGYPKSGLNYDIFSNAGSFGKTDLEMKTYQQYQLQENLRGTILMLDKIEDCVVLINLPEDSMFVLSNDRQQAGASVMLSIKNGGGLTNAEAKAIGALVATSVPGLKPENVSIVDSNMVHYDTAASDAEQYTATQYELTEQVKSTLTEQVLSVLRPVFGQENVSAAVNVALNFDKETVNSLELAPPVEGEDNGLVISMEELYERANVGDAEGIAGTESNGLGVNEYLYENADPRDFSKISRAINYELNQTQTQIEKAQGSIQQLSVAVLLNSEVYSEDYSEGVTQLISRAIGVNEALVSVVSMPFQEREDGLEGAFNRQADFLKKQNTKDIIKTAIIALAIVIVMVLLVGLLRAAFVTPRQMQMQMAMAGEAPGSTFSAIVGGSEEMPIMGEDGMEEIPDIMKSKDAEQIERFLDKNPAAVTQLLRNWLTD